MKLDNLLYSPSLIGYALTQPLVRSNLHFKVKISLSVGNEQLLYKIDNLVATVLWGTLALVGMAIKCADFYLNYKVTPLVVSEQDQRLLVRSLEEAVEENRLTPELVRDLYRRGLNYSEDCEKNWPDRGPRRQDGWDTSRNIGARAMERLFYRKVIYNNADWYKGKLTSRDLETFSALLQCGAQVKGELLRDVLEHGTEIELLTILMANGGDRECNYQSCNKANLLDFAITSDSVTKVVLAYHLNPALNSNRMTSKIEEINSFLSRMRA